MHTKASGTVEALYRVSAEMVTWHTLQDGRKVLSYLHRKTSDNLHLQPSILTVWLPCRKFTLTPPASPPMTFIPSTSTTDMLTSSCTLPSGQQRAITISHMLTRGQRRALTISHTLTRGQWRALTIFHTLPSGQRKALTTSHMTEALMGQNLVWQE